MNEKQLRSELDAVYRSTSWRVTAPLRWLSSFVRRYFLSPLSPRRLLAVLISFILRRPKLASFIQGCLIRFPRLRERIRRLYYRSNRVERVQLVLSHEIELDQTESQRLSPVAQSIYLELRNAVKGEM